MNKSEIHTFYSYFGHYQLEKHVPRRLIHPQIICKW